MTPDVSLGEHAVLRVAAWSIESVAVFRAPELAAATDAWIADELAHAEVAAALCDRLHAAVPRLERRARAAALRTKRRLFGGQELPALDGATGAALRAIDPDLTSALDAARRARQAL
ncbi:MAG: hypothetical protein H6713_38275, partial [Myxococcales bacterium]|nr:hypothetical protein [Myxococcales bacterium]